MLKRYLEATEASPAELDLATFQSLIRLGNERDLLKSDWSAWKIYRQARTDSSHACDHWGSISACGGVTQAGAIAITQAALRKVRLMRWLPSTGWGLSLSGATP